MRKKKIKEVEVEETPKLPKSPEEIFSTYSTYEEVLRELLNLNERLNYYSLNRVLEEDCHYSMIYGERSDGKTFSVLEYGLLRYIFLGEKMAIIRRYDVDFQGKRGREVFKNFTENAKFGNMIKTFTEGKWSTIYYYSGCWYFAKRTEKGELLREPDPFCYAFAITGQEHDKSTSFPRITTILFDEFITRGIYLPEEFVLFTNVLSTIIRDRDDVKIFMCGNTVNKYNLYFAEMGLDNVRKMKQGDIQIYKFAVYNKLGEKTDKELKVCVNFSDGAGNKGKSSDVYFAFGNPKLQMITNGIWELAIYPHLPYKYTKDNICGEYFIVWEEDILHCEIIQQDMMYYTYIHRKTTPIQDEKSDIVFTLDYNPAPNFRRKITNPPDEIGRKIYYFFKNDKVFYQDNEVGEIVRNYIQWCKSDRGFI